MSYTKVRNMSINFKNRTISGSYASNNVFPITYESTKYEAKNDQEFMNEIRGIFKNIAGGTLQFNFSTRSKVRWAYYKSIEGLNINIISDLYFYDCDTLDDYESSKTIRSTDISFEDAQRIYSQTFNKFLHYLTEIQPREKNYIKVDGYYLYSMDKYGCPSKYTYFPKKEYTEGQYLEIKRMYPKAEWIEKEA